MVHDRLASQELNKMRSSVGRRIVPGRIFYLNVRGRLVMWRLTRGDWLVALIMFVSLAISPLVRSEAVSPEKSPQPHAEEKASAVKAAPPSPGPPQGSPSSTPAVAPDTSKPATGATKEGEKGVLVELAIAYKWPLFYLFLLVMLSRKGRLERILARLVEMLDEVSPTKVAFKGVTLEFERSEKFLEIAPMSPFRMGDDDRQNGPPIILGLKSADIIPEFVTQLEFETSELATESVQIKDKDRVRAKIVELEKALNSDDEFRGKLWEVTQAFEKARFYQSMSFAEVLNKKTNLSEIVTEFPSEPQRRFIMHCVGAAYVRSGETGWEEKAVPYLKSLVEQIPLYPPAVDDYLTCEYHRLIRRHRTFDASFVREIEKFGRRMQGFKNRIDPSRSQHWGTVVDDDGKTMIQNSEWFYFYQYLRGVPVILSLIAENLPVEYRDLRAPYLEKSIKFYGECQGLRKRRKRKDLYDDYLLENNLADSYRAMRDSKSYETALKILRYAIGREKRPILFRTLAEVYQEMGEYQDALKAIRSSKWEDIDQENKKDDVSEYIENKIFEAKLLFYQPNVPKRSRVDKGIKALQEALDVLTSYLPDGKKEKRVSILERLGYLYAEIENWEKSVDNYRGAYRLIMAPGDSGDVQQTLSAREEKKALELFLTYFYTELRLAESLFFDHDVDGARQYYIELLDEIANWQKYIKKKLEGRIEISDKYSGDLDRMARSAHLGAGECFRQRYVLHWAEEDFVKATDYFKKVLGYGGPLERQANWELGEMYLKKALKELKTGVQTAQATYYYAVNYLEHAAQHSGDTGIFRELSEVYNLEKRFGKASSKDKT